MIGRGALVAFAAGVALAVGAWMAHQHAVGVAVGQAVAAERQAQRDAASRALAASNARALAAETRAVMADLENRLAEQDLTRRTAGAVAGARAESDSLRRVIAAMLSGGGASAQGSGAVSLIDGAPAAARALSECVGEYQGVAEVADRAINQVIALQGYIKRVLPAVCPIDWHDGVLSTQ